MQSIAGDETTFQWKSYNIHTLRNRENFRALFQRTMPAEQMKENYTTSFNYD